MNPKNEPFFKPPRCPNCKREENKIEVCAYCKYTYETIPLWISLICNAALTGMVVFLLFKLIG